MDNSNQINYNSTSIENAYRCLKKMQELENTPNFGKFTYNLPEDKTSMNENSDGISNGRYTMEQYVDEIDSPAYTDIATETLSYNIWFLSNHFGDVFSNDIISSIAYFQQGEKGLNVSGLDIGDFLTVNDEKMSTTKYEGVILTAPAGFVEYDRWDGKHVKETWCDLPLGALISNIKKYEGEKIVNGQRIKDLEYWVRDDGVKMLGPYVIVAADVRSRISPWTNEVYYQGGTCSYGDIVETTLGPGLILDYCGDAVSCRKKYGEDYVRYDIYTAWHDSSYEGMVYSEGYVPKNYANNPLLEPTGGAIMQTVEYAETVVDPIKTTVDPTTPVTPMEPVKPITPIGGPTLSPSIPTRPVKPTPVVVKLETPSAQVEPIKPMPPSVEPITVNAAPKSADPIIPNVESTTSSTPIESVEPTTPSVEPEIPVTEQIEPVIDPIEPQINSGVNNGNRFDGRKIILPGILGTGLAFLAAKFGKIIKKKKENDEV